MTCQNFNILCIPQVNACHKENVQRNYILFFTLRVFIFCLPYLLIKKTHMFLCPELTSPFTVPLYSTLQLWKVNRGMALLIFNLSDRWSGWSMPHPGHFIPTKRPCYTMYRWLGGILGQSGQMWIRHSILSPLCLEPWTIQPYILSSQC